MSPTALDVPGHHDSFSLPRGGDDVKVHSSAKRSPEGGLIKVESEDVVYDESEIRAKYTDRGAHVTSTSLSLRIGLVADEVEDANGKLTVKKTEKHYEFLTKSKVGKVG
jgi:myo-inositol-1-phosphate synthase